MTRAPRKWRSAVDALPRNEPGLRIRDALGAEAVSHGGLRWQWVVHSDGHPANMMFDLSADPAAPAQPRFPVTEVLPEGDQTP